MIESAYLQDDFMQLVIHDSLDRSSFERNPIYYENLVGIIKGD